MEFLGIAPSTRKGKKYDAFFEVDGRVRKVPFGAYGMDDFTITGDVEQRDRYRRRHAKDRLEDPMSAGALSWYILWTAPTLKGGLRNYTKAFGF